MEKVNVFLILPLTWLVLVPGYPTSEISSFPTQNNEDKPEIAPPYFVLPHTIGYDGSRLKRREVKFIPLGNIPASYENNQPNPAADTDSFTKRIPELGRTSQATASSDNYPTYSDSFPIRSKISRNPQPETNGQVKFIPLSGDAAPGTNQQINDLRKQKSIVPIKNSYTETDPYFVQFLSAPVEHNYREPAETLETASTSVFMPIFSYRRASSNRRRIFSGGAGRFRDARPRFSLSNYQGDDYFPTVA